MVSSWYCSVYDNARQGELADSVAVCELETYGFGKLEDDERLMKKVSNLKRKGKTGRRGSVYEIEEVGNFLSAEVRGVESTAVLTESPLSS